MTPAARSVFVFGTYVCVVGIGVVTFPNLVIGPLGFPVAREPWIRVLGTVAFVLGLYYVQAGRENVVSFFRWTVWAVEQSNDADKAAASHAALRPIRVFCGRHKRE